MEERIHDQRLANEKILHKKLDAASWGVFFIWVAIAFLADVGWGAGLLGVGSIILGTQVIRKYLGLKLEGFWVVFGFFFVLGGVWELFNVQFIGIIPVLCIGVGLAVLVPTLLGKPRDFILCRYR